MPSNQYLQDILNKKSSTYFDSLNLNNISSVLYPILKEWSRGCDEEIFIAGSSAKGTAIKGKSDLDIFISIKHSCIDTPKILFNNLFSWLQFKGFNNIRKQNVSIGIKAYGCDIDIVPAKLQPGYTNYHWLYKSKIDSIQQTNVKAQISHIKNSGRTAFIKLTKIWRDCWSLDFPSVNLELSVIEALKYKAHNISYSDGFLSVLDYLKNDFSTARLVDPFNSNNIISEDMTNAEKISIQEKAKECRSYTYWRDIIW